MSRIVMYSTEWCPYCKRAEAFLGRKGVTEIEKINIDRVEGEREKMEALTGRRTVPQIFIGERHVGGFDDLVALDRAGELDALLNGA